MKKTGWIILAVGIALALLMGGIRWGYTGRYPSGPWGMMGGQGMMGGFAYPMMGWLGGFGMLFFWVLVIGGIVWLGLAAFRRHEYTGTPPSAGETPLDILKRRYAAGEIDKEQFDETRRNLEQ